MLKKIEVVLFRFYIIFSFKLNEIKLLFKSNSLFNYFNNKINSKLTVQVDVIYYFRIRFCYLK